MHTKLENVGSAGFRAIELAGLLALILGSAAHAESPRVVVVPNQGFEDGYWHEYFVDLLAIALERTGDEPASYEIRTSDLVMDHQDRALRCVKQGELVDVAWAMTTRQREQDMLPIRIPLTRGLLGYRVFIVEREDVANFATVQDLDGLQAFVAGQGLDWPDTEILRANGLPVMTGRDFGGLFEMLRRDRFDYFPRGVVEAGLEVEGGLGGKDLEIEPRLLLHYPAAVYFFVHRDATDLAQQIEAGLRRAIEDGSFDAHFLETHQEVIASTRMHSRVILHLDNPLLSPETPLDETALWYHLGPEPTP